MFFRFFFSSRRRHTRWPRDWSSDVCSSDLPVLIDRTEMVLSGNNRQTHREWIYRQAFHMGRHIIGYEVQKVMAAVEWFSQTDHADGPAQTPIGSAKTRIGPIQTPVGPSKTMEPAKAPIGVAGYGEGGLVALYAAAVDERIDAVLVSGYFDDRQQVWEEPVYRNVWGLLSEFGDA